MLSMRRAIAIALGVAAAPSGIGLGLWMAQLTSGPRCVALGLGTQAFCIPVPLLAPSLCVLCGAAAAAALLVLSIVLHRPASLAPAFDLAAAGAGIAIGLWASLIVTFVRCGPLQGVCGSFGIQSFTAWESALIGAAAAAAIVALGCAASSELRQVNLDTARRLRRWLFKDLSQTTTADRTEATRGRRTTSIFKPTHLT